MAWLDRISPGNLWYQGKAAAATAGRNVAEHLNTKADEILKWYADKKTEHQQLNREREDAKQRISELKNQRKFPGMTREQRAAGVAELAKQMPGRAAILHSHPVASFLTSPLRIGWSALKSIGKKGAAIAPHISRGSNTWLLALAFFYHLMIIFFLEPTILNRVWINFAMILIVIFIIFDQSERNGDTYRTLFLFVFGLEIIIPLIVAKFSILRQFDFIRLYLANNLIILTWIYYAVFIRGKDINVGPTKWVRAIIVIFWLGVVFFFIGETMVDISDIQLAEVERGQWQAAILVYEKGLEGWKVLINGIFSGFSNMQEIFEMRMKMATGEYYYGVVEENEKEPLGVYLENLKASQKEFEENEKVTVFATLKARTLNDVVNVNVGCYAEKARAKINGSVYPEDSFEVFNLQEEELDCSFAQLPEGTNKITYTADFNFETIGYLKRYFADRDAIAAATRLGIELLDEYKISDKEPVSHYTNGPVAIGMGPEQALIGVSENYTVKPRFAVTLDSSSKGWGGVIKELNELVLFMPIGLSLDKSQCTDSDWTTYDVGDCIQNEIKYESRIAQECNNEDGCIEKECSKQLTGYNAYSLNLDEEGYKNIKDFITISCRLNVDDTVRLLGATPIATHYFYVKTRYDYEVSEDTSIKVTESKEEDLHE